MRAPSRSLGWLMRLLGLGMFMLVLNPGFGTAAFGAGGITVGPRSAAAQDNPDAVATINVELVLDSSGSMIQEIAPGLTRIDAAKNVLRDVIAAIPEREGINVGFRVFGHEGNNTESGRAESCQSSDLVVPIEGVDKDALNAQVDQYQPVGWTPITLSLERAGGDFVETGDNIANAVILVTDGLETCEGDPCAAARALAGSEASVTTHVIGFGLTQEDQQTLQCIADEGGGLNLGAGSADELSAALFTVLQELQVIVETGFFEIEAFGEVFPRCTITGQSGATDSNPEGEAVSITLTDSNRVELNAGLYTVTWLNPSGEETRITVNIEAGRTTWVRGSLLKFPQGAGEIYTVRDLAGITIWQDQITQGDFVWVLPGIYRLELLERVGDPVLISAEVQTLPGSVTQLEVFTAGS